MTEHALAQEQIASYLADGLDAAERSAFEAHVASCPECTHSLEECRAVDARLSQLFIGERPRPGLEDRLIRRLRTPVLTVRRSMPLAGWIGIGAAATVAVGVVGAGMMFVMEGAEEAQNARAYREGQLQPLGQEPQSRLHGLFDRSESMSVDESAVTSLRTLNGNPEPETSFVRRTSPSPDAESTFGSLPVGGLRGPVRLLTADERAKEARESALAPLQDGKKARTPGGGKIFNEEIGSVPDAETRYDTQGLKNKEESAATRETHRYDQGPGGPGLRRNVAGGAGRRAPAASARAQGGPQRRIWDADRARQGQGL